MLLWSRRACRIVVSTSLAIATCGIAAAKEPPPEQVAGEVLVRFKSGVRAPQVDAVLAAEGARAIKHYWINDVWRLQVSRDVTEVLASLGSNPLVEYANPNYVVHALAMPNDPGFGDLYGLHNTGQNGGTPDADIDAPEAWDLATDAGSVLIGVIDTGIDYNHPDLAANVWTNPNEIPGNGVDDDGNGYVDDVHGINAITGTGDPMDDNKHGTHVSGTIGAVGNNGIGVTGVDWKAKLLACKCLNASGTGNAADATECVQYTTAMGVKLTSNSWGGGGFDQGLRDAIQAAGSAGILFVAAAGNNNADNDVTPFYPSGYASSNVIAVAATDRKDQRATFSSYGVTSVDVAAPGVDISSTIPVAMGSYGILSGTSMATPHVAGVAALVWSQFPTLTSDDVKDRILLTTESKPGLVGKVLSGGRINAYQALTATIAAPHVFYVSPAAAYAGDTLTLMGARFGAAQATGSVAVGGRTAAITSWSNDAVVVTVPDDLPGGPNAVVVTTPTGIADASTFTMLVPYYTRSLVTQDLVGGGVAQNWRDDDGCWSYALPFLFEYFGNFYASVYVCSNGILDFGGPNLEYKNSDANLGKRPIVAALWDDLRTDPPGRDIYVTASPNAVVFRWDAQTYSGAIPVNFEAVLNANGSIRFNYGAGNTGLTPTVGISEGGNLRSMLAPHDDASQLTHAQSVYYDPIVASGCVPVSGDECGVFGDDFETGDMSKWSSVTP